MSPLQEITDRRINLSKLGLFRFPTCNQEDIPAKVHRLEAVADGLSQQTLSSIPLDGLADFASDHKPESIELHPVRAGSEDHQGVRPDLALIPGLLKFRATA
jgi:hypothetical protein